MPIHYFHDSETMEMAMLANGAMNGKVSPVAYWSFHCDRSRCAGIQISVRVAIRRIDREIGHSLPAITFAQLRTVDRPPPPDAVIGHTNLYWSNQLAPEDPGGVTTSEDVVFAFVICESGDRAVEPLVSPSSGASRT